MAGRSAGAFVMMPQPSQVWLAVESIDMRLGIDGLSLRIQQALGKSPCDGSAYAFRNRRSNRLKLLCWDGTGVWLCQRRLHGGHFVWPQAGETICLLSAAQWQWLVSGVDWQRLSAPSPGHWQL
ncbi:MAG: IS66 family insertion sequence element accessory protein TnpB [Candidatus Angelobacter sp.]